MIGHDVPIKTLRCSMCPANSIQKSRLYQHSAHRLSSGVTHVGFGRVVAREYVPLRQHALSEDYWIPPGELSEIDRTAGLDAPENVYRCFGCKEPACQVLPPVLMNPHIIRSTYLASHEVLASLMHLQNC